LVYLRRRLCDRSLLVQRWLRVVSKQTRGNRTLMTADRRKLLQRQASSALCDPTSACVDLLRISWTTCFTISCVVVRVGDRGAKFWVVGKLSENFVSVGKFSSKNAKFGAENPDFKSKIIILSTHNLLCRKIATSCPAYFLNPRRRCRQQAVRPLAWTRRQY